MADSLEKLGKHPRARKKGKAQYAPRKKVKVSRSGVPMELSCGMQGVLITTGDQVKLCVPEAYNLLNKYADQLYGPEFSTSPQDSHDSSDSDIGAALAKEVNSLKGSVQRERRFKSVNSGAKHVVFITCAPPVDPCELVHTILTDVAASGERVSRYCQRIVPVVRVCRANMADISKHAAEVLEPHFHSDHTHIIKYAVSYKARNNTVVKRDDVIKLVAAAVTMDGDYDHVVDLNNPDLTVVVEIIKNLCCLSVIRDFHKFSKYNIHMLTEPNKTAPTTEESGKTAPAAQTTTEVSDSAGGGDTAQLICKESGDSSLQGSSQPAAGGEASSSTHVRGVLGQPTAVIGDLSTEQNSSDDGVNAAQENSERGGLDRT